MRVAVIGGGSIGAVAASSAAAAGHDVAVCVRTPVDRLVIRRSEEDHLVPATIVTSPDSVAAPAEVVVLAVKVQDTAAAASWLDVLCGPSTVIVTMQNGLDHEARVRAVSAAAAGCPVVPTVSYIAAERTGPGRVTHHFGRAVTVSSGPAAASAVAGLGTELDVDVSADFTTALWRKLVGNTVINPVTTLALRRVDVLAEPATRDLVRALVAEAVDVGRAAGARFDPGVVDALMDRYSGPWSREGSGSSMLYDRWAGRPLEHEALSGALVETAHRLGVPVPHHETILALLRVLDPAAEVARLRPASSSSSSDGTVRRSGPRGRRRP